MKRSFSWFLKFHVLLLLSAISLHPSIVFAQGTAFSYQGRLNGAGAPANGLYDLVFEVFALPAGGSAVSGPVTNAATALASGLFNVSIDFGAGIFDGSERWLQISVRTNGPGAFTVLTPRQPLRPAPYSLFASNSGVASAALTAGTLTGNVSASQIIGT